MTQGLPPMQLQARIVDDIARLVASGVDGGWERLRYRVHAVGGIVVDSLATVSRGVEVGSLPPLGLGPMVEQLRAAMHRPGAGTWFAMELAIDATRRVSTRFEYDTEPRLDVPFAAADYVRDLHRFQRDLERQPPWLRDRLAEGMVQPPSAASVTRTPAGFVLTADNAAEVLQQRATLAGLRDHPALRELFDDDAAGSEDDYRRWYTTWFPVLFPGSRVERFRVDDRSIDEIHLRGDLATLDAIGALPWRNAAEHTPRSTGAQAWWSMFLAFIPIPVVSTAVWLTVTAVAAFSNRHPRGSVARENGRNGFNWAVTHLLLTLVSLGWIAVFTAVGMEPRAYPGADVRYSPIAGVGIVGGLAIAFLTVLAWVHCIRGSIRAGRGEIYRAWGAIPFLRPAQHSA